MNTKYFIANQSTKLTEEMEIQGMDSPEWGWIFVHNPDKHAITNDTIEVQEEFGSAASYPSVFFKSDLLEITEHEYKVVEESLAVSVDNRNLIKAILDLAKHRKDIQEKS